MEIARSLNMLGEGAENRNMDEMRIKATKEVLEKGFDPKEMTHNIL